MINTTTYSSAWAYLQANPQADLFWFINMEDDGSNNYYFTDYPTQTTNYIPAQIDISGFVMEASIYRGVYSIRPVKVMITNIRRPQGDTTYARFEENFASNELETELCTISMGYRDGGESNIVPIYKGRMTNFKYSALSLEFEVTDRAIYELPEIPVNTFTRGEYAYISEDMLGKPIPIVYGRHDYETGDSTRYGDRVFVPAVIIQNDQANDDIILQISDMALDAINGVYLFDDSRGIYEHIEDTITNDLANGKCTVNLYTDAANIVLTTNVYIYGARAEGTSSNPSNTVDWDFDTFATLTNGETCLIYPREFPAYGSDIMEADYSDSNGYTSVGMNTVRLFASGYTDAGGSGSWSTGTLTLSIANSNWSYTRSAAQVNALTDTDTFNITSSADIQIAYTYEFDGSTNLFQISEATDGAGTGATGPINIQPTAGVYTSLDSLAAEAGKRLAALVGGTVNGTYSVTYDHKQNKFIIKQETEGGAYSHFKIYSSGQSSDIGFTGDTGWDDNSHTSDSYTILDVPDGDFSNVILKCTHDDPDQSFFLKTMALNFDRTYKSFNYVLSRRVLDIKTNLKREDFPPSDWQPPNPNYWKFKWESDKNRTIKETLAASRFFALVDGKPDDSTSYWKKGPNIIESLLSDHIGIAAGDMNAASFTTAAGNLSDELALYLGTKTRATDVLFDLARYSKGFLFIDHAGDYTMINIKSSYSSGDVDFTIYDRDILAPIQRNLQFGRNSIDEISNDLTFGYLFNHGDGSYQASINQTTTSALNLVEKKISCEYINHDDYASNMADHFAGDGGTIGFFGAPKVVAELTTLNPQFHFAELGDIMQFDTGWDSHFKAFGGTLSSIYFMVLKKQFSRREITLKLLEVG